MSDFDEDNNAEDDDDFDADEIMEEHWGEYPDLDFTWQWLREEGHRIFQEEHEARDKGDDERAGFKMQEFFTVSCLLVRVAEQVLERIKSKQVAAEEKFVRWSFLVEAQSP